MINFLYSIFLLLFIATVSLSFRVSSFSLNGQILFNVQAKKILVRRTAKENVQFANAMHSRGKAIRDLSTCSCQIIQEIVGNSTLENKYLQTWCIKVSA